MCVCVCECVFVCVCARARVCACVRVCVCACVINLLWGTRQAIEHKGARMMHYFPFSLFLPPVPYPGQITCCYTVFN